MSMDYYVVEKDDNSGDASKDGGHFLKATRGRAEAERHLGVTENAGVSDEGSKVAALRVQGNL